MEVLRVIRKRLGSDLCAADSCHRTRDRSADPRYPFCARHDWNNCTPKRSRLLGENTDLNAYRGDQEIRED